MTAPSSRDGLIAALGTAPDRLVATATAAADRPVEPGEWTVEEVVRHLIAVEMEVHQGRLRDLVTVPEPRWSWTEPGPWAAEPDLGLSGVLRRFAELRGETLSMVAALDEAGWGRTGHHATFGPLDVAGLLRNAVDHDEDHLRGIGRD